MLFFFFPKSAINLHVNLIFINYTSKEPILFMGFSYKAYSEVNIIMLLHLTQDYPLMIYLNYMEIVALTHALSQT